MHSICIDIVEGRWMIWREKDNKIWREKDNDAKRRENDKGWILDDVSKVVAYLDWSGCRRLVYMYMSSRRLIDVCMYLNTVYMGGKLRHVACTIYTRTYSACQVNWEGEGLLIHYSTFVCWGRPVGLPSLWWDTCSCCTCEFQGCYALYASYAL